MAKIDKTAIRTCEDCIHEHACQAWNMGTIHNMDASRCPFHETVLDSPAYYCGFTEGLRTARENMAKWSEEMSISESWMKFADDLMKYLRGKLPDIPEHVAQEIGTHIANRTTLLVMDALCEQNRVLTKKTRSRYAPKEEA